MLDLDSAFMTFPILHTERLTLRALTIDDVDAVYAVMADAQVTRYFGRLPMQDRAEAVARITGEQSAFQERSGIRWAITLRHTGDYLGSGGFWRLIPDHARAEIGYELASARWGRGYAPEALRAMLDFGFSTLGLNSVEAQIHPDNVASRRVLEKLGFVLEGTLRQNYYDPVESGFTDTQYFGLVRGDW